MAGQAGGGKAAAPGSSGLSWMFIFLFMMLILFNAGTRQLLGDAIGVVLNPLLAGDGSNPMWSIFIGLIIVASATQTIRHFMTNWIKMAENQNFMKAFNKELSEARKSQNQQRTQKLMEMQPQVMSKQMEVQSMTMKPTVFTMILFIAFITWIYAFVAIAAVNVVAVPWNHEVKLSTGGFFSSTLLIYILFSIPMYQIITNIWKYITFSKKLRTLDAVDVPEVTL
ncbi:MAG: EMC3/TMCO1 family protein [Candidatus Thermoplasmatota archaeon]|nr:EMC3/TMCO1 family protein [Candidatus Thermoplasmatota archaeon]